MKRTRDQNKRSMTLADCIELQPYRTSIKGHIITIDKNIFPSDQSYGTSLLMDAITSLHSERSIVNGVDVGTGSGIIAIHMANYIKQVFAIDNYRSAMKCAHQNFREHRLEQQINLIQGDLLSPFHRDIPLDLVVFNHNFYPINRNRFGISTEGGAPLIYRFLQQAKEFSIRTILMPYSTIATRKHNPEVIAKTLGFKTSIIQRENHNTIYKFEENNAKLFAFAAHWSGDICPW